MTEPKKSKVIEAAGGVVEYETVEGPVYAIICRERYGREWALPKGKREPGEDWQQTALREVAEETGLSPQIVGVAGAAAYHTGIAPKIVLYWHMRIDGAPPRFVPNEEVSELAWLTLDEAVRRLDHPEEAAVLKLLKRRL